MQDDGMEESQSGDKAETEATPSSCEQNLQSSEMGTKENQDAITHDDSQPADPDEGWDDTDYTPDFIEDWLDAPPILPNDDADAFRRLFESFELENQHRPKTDFEYRFTFTATVIAWDLLRYDRIRAAIIAKEGPGAVKVLHRRLGLDQVAQAEADQPKPPARNASMQYFADPEYRKDFMRKLESYGFGRSAVEAEAFGRALNSLSVIDRLIKSAEKRLADCLKRLEEAYRGRDPEQPMPRSMAAHRAADRRRKRDGLG